MMRYAFYIIFLLIVSCNSSEKKLKAQEIIDKTIEVSGADLVKNSVITFDFRDRKYKAIRKNGQFYMDRILLVDSTAIRDIITNDGFQRLVNEKKAIVPDTMATRFANSVNSVHYFSVLPYGLNDLKQFRKNYCQKFRLKEMSITKLKFPFLKKMEE